MKLDYRFQPALQLAASRSMVQSDPGLDPS